MTLTLSAVDCLLYSGYKVSTVGLRDLLLCHLETLALSALKPGGVCMVFRLQLRLLLHHRWRKWLRGRLLKNSSCDKPGTRPYGDFATWLGPGYYQRSYTRRKPVKGAESDACWRQANWASKSDRAMRGHTFQSGTVLHNRSQHE